MVGEVVVVVVAAAAAAAAVARRRVVVGTGRVVVVGGWRGSRRVVGLGWMGLVAVLHGTGGCY